MITLLLFLNFLLKTLLPSKTDLRRRLQTSAAANLLHLITLAIVVPP